MRETWTRGAVLLICLAGCESEPGTAGDAGDASEPVAADARLETPEPDAATVDRSPDQATREAAAASTCDATLPDVPAPAAPTAARIDTSFGTDGLVSFIVSSSNHGTHVKCLSAGDDSGITFGGAEDLEGVGPFSWAVRLTFAGERDPGYVSDRPGYVPLPGLVTLGGLLSSCAVQAGGAFVRAGWVPALMRLTRTGTLDTSLAGPPVLPGPSRPSVMGLSCGGDIIVAEQAEVLRVRPDGTIPDPALQLPASIEPVVKVARQAPGGRVLLAGRAGGTGVFVARLDGSSLDPSFGSGGWTRVETGGSSPAVALAILPDGRIVLVTGPGIRVARLDADGQLDTGFGSNGVVSNPFDGQPSDAVAPPEGGVIVSLLEASSAIALVRLDAEGRPDATFAPGGRFELPVLGRIDPALRGITNTDREALLSRQADGRLVVATTLPRAMTPGNSVPPPWSFTLTRVILQAAGR